MNLSSSGHLLQRYIIQQSQDWTKQSKCTEVRTSGHTLVCEAFYLNSLLNAPRTVFFSVELLKSVASPHTLVRI